MCTRICKSKDVCNRLGLRGGTRCIIEENGTISAVVVVVVAVVVFSYFCELGVKERIWLYR